MTERNNKHSPAHICIVERKQQDLITAANSLQLDSCSTGRLTNSLRLFHNDNKLSGFSYQDVPFQKKTGLDGDADAGLAVTLNIAAKQKV